MCNPLRNSCTCILRTATFILALVLTSVGTLSAQALGCNDSVQVSLDANCEANISPDMILEGADVSDPTAYTVTIGGVVGTIVTTPGTYQVTVTRNSDGNNCWGNIVVEDKLPPQIDGTDPDECQCPAGGEETTSFAGTFGATSPILNVPQTAACAPFTAVISEPTLRYESYNFTVTTGGNYDFEIPAPVGTCSVIYAVYTGNFDPNNPCDNIVTFPGGTSAAGYFDSASMPTSVAINGLPLGPGEYSVAVCSDPNDPGCDYTVDVAGSSPIFAISEDCSFKCTDLAGVQDGTVAVPQPIVDENCGGLTSIFTDVLSPRACGEQILTRTWLFTDAAGNTSNGCVQQFVVEPVDIFADITAPQPTVELNCNAGFSMPEIFAFYEPLVGAAAATTYAWPTVDGVALNGLLCNTAVTKSDQIIPICGNNCSGNNKVIRTWTVIDWCTGASRNFVQVIKAADTEDPTIEAADFTTTVDPWGCQGNFLLPDPTLLHDNCDASLTYTVLGPVGVSITLDPATGRYLVFGAPKGVHTFTYVAADCCGNTTNLDITVTIEDKTAPNAVAIQNLVVSLTSGGSQGDGQAKVFATSVDNGSHDGCGPVHLEVRRVDQPCSFNGNTTFNNDGHSNDSPTDSDDGEFVKFCCADIDDVSASGTPFGMVEVVLRVWDDGDMDGVFGSAGDNYNETWAFVRVEDKLAPAIVCPPDITVNCDTDVTNLDVVGEASSYSTCGAVAVDYTDTDLTDNCSAGDIRRRWFIVGQPGIFCTQVITKAASDPFDGSISWPIDMTTDCLNLTGAPEAPTYSSGVCDMLAYSVKSDTFLFEDGACFKILNNYTVIDWCQYKPNDPSFNGEGIWTHVQVIKVEDNDAPILEGCTNPVINVGGNNGAGSNGGGSVCEISGIMLTNSANDMGDCASDWLKWNIEVDVWGDNTVEYVYSSNISPASPFYVAATTSGQEVKITIPDPIEGSMFNHKVRWRVTDGCGNVASCSTTFMVTDLKPPTPFCINVSTALMQNGGVEIWACDFDLGSTDNCSAQSDLRFTFSDVKPQDDPTYVPSTKCSARTFTCADLPSIPGTPIPVDVYVWDEKDNADFCTVMLTLLDNNGVCGGMVQSALIAGKVANENGDEIKDVEIQLDANIINFTKNTMTDVAGEYSFASNPMYSNYTIIGEKNDDYLNGVSTLDLVLIQKHILGMQSLNSPYKIIAADINNDENVSAIDLIELRKLILGIYNELPNNDSWRFVDADEQFGNINDPFPFTEELSINQLDTDEMDEEFIGVKIGDVNNSAAINLSSGNAENKSSNKLMFVVDELDLVAGETYNVNFRAENFVNVIGYQFTLDHTGLEMNDIDEASLAIRESNFGSISSNHLTMSWSEVNGVSVSPEEALFTVNFTALKSGKLSDYLAINSRKTTAESYDVNYNSSDVILAFESEDAVVISNDFELYQNSPNPFSDQTTIGFNMPQDGKASLTIYDVTGKVLYTVNDSYPAGYNQIQITKENLDGARGILYYQLESGSNIATMKMIEIE